ncbi:MAG: oligosaccharide flippase family protein, partial [Chloroflexi bacterium]|nr:oligosaccharide flippase family protein [Chloroflexota bacterium]
MQESTPEPLGPLPVPATAGMLRAVLHDSVQYALGGLAYKAVALLSVPILARLLVPADLGMLDLAVVVALVVAITGAVGLENALARLDAEEPANARLWGSAGLLLTLGVAIVGGAGLTLSAPLA